LLNRDVDALIGTQRPDAVRAKRKSRAKTIMLNRSKSMKLLQSLKYAGVASLALSSSIAMASLTFDADGVGGNGAVQADLFDWSPSSFLAKNGTTAITAWNSVAAANPGMSDAEVTAACGSDCYITVYTHASLIGTSLADGTVTTASGLTNDYEITMVTSFTETVSGTGSIGGQEIASFDIVTSEGASLELYYDDLGDDTNGTLDANNLLGNGFNDGKLILTGTTIEDSTGSFNVVLASGIKDLDQAATDDYPTIDTVVGSGNQGTITVGDFTLDSDHFLTELSEFTLAFANISQALPFISVDPSECFTQNFGGTTISGTQTQPTADCDTAFDPTMGTADTQGGMTPNIGTLNGLTAQNGGGPDFIAQTDFNSPVTGIPSPAPLALMSIGLLGLGFFGRKKAKHAA
jgi:hypothetical protein